MEKVVLTFKMKSVGLNLLKKHFQVISLLEEFTPQKLRTLGKIFALIVSPAQKVNKEIIDAAEGLRIICTQSAGYDHVDVKYATERGILVCRISGELTETVAEHAMAMALTAWRRLHETHQITKNGEWKSYAQIWRKYKNLRTLKGKVAGIVGMGEIGRKLVPKLKGFDMKVVYYSRRKKEVDAEYLPLEDLFKVSDIIFLAVPLTEETRGMVNSDLLSKMKEGAILVNVARGPVIVERDLVEELKKGRIYAALDVYSQEPLPRDSELLKLENVLLSPHYAGLSVEGMESAALEAATSVIDYYFGKVPKYVVNPEVLDERSPRALFQLF